MINRLNLSILLLNFGKVAYKYSSKLAAFHNEEKKSGVFQNTCVTYFVSRPQMLSQEVHTFCTKIEKLLDLGVTWDIMSTECLQYRINDARSRLTLVLKNILFLN